MMSTLNDTIVAISTPIGEGGIGIVRLSGKKALSIADRIFVSKDGKKPSSFKTYSVHYGHIVTRFGSRFSVLGSRKDSPKSEHRAPSTEIIDEVLLTVMRSPRSYTKEDVVEINCHGGIAPLRKILEKVVSMGVRPAQPGEFTKRAFLNGRIDLAQAEAVVDVVRAKTDASLKVAMGQLKGAFSKEINKQRDRLLKLLEHIEAHIDFSEEELDVIPKTEIACGLNKITAALKSVLKTYHLGMILREGIMCVICGKPNVGKSSLFNALLRRNRAIVTDIAGTTRDTIEENISIKGIPVRLVDTAGIVKSKNTIDKMSIEKTRACLKRADLIIFMLDLSKSFGKKDQNILRAINLNQAIIVANKSDLKRRLDLDRVKRFRYSEVIEISILKKRNLDMVEDLIAKKIWAGGVVHPEAAFLTNVRHKRELIFALNNLKRALVSLRGDLPFELIALDIREALFHLGLIIGKSVDIDILDRIFENFCIGK